MNGNLVNLLLLEDNPIDARLVKKLLDKDRYAVYHAGTLAAALSHLAQEEIHLILADLGLPDSHGLDTLIQIIHQAPHLPVIALTGNEDEDVVSQAVQQGAQDYLVKGQFDKKLLARAIQYAMDRHRVETILKQELALAQAVFHAVPLGIVVLDAQGHIIQFNQAVERLTGFSAADIWDTFFWDLFLSPQDGVAFAASFPDLGSSSNDHEREGRWRTKAGDELPVRWTCTVLSDLQGQPEFYILIATPIPATP